MNNPHRMDDLLSRHRLSELPPHLEKEVLDFLSTREGRRRLEELEAEDERILLELPPRRVADEIRRRLDTLRHGERSPARRTAVGWLAGSGLAVALGGLAVVASLRGVSPVPTPESALAAPPAKTESVVPTESTASPAHLPAAKVTKTPEAQVAQAPATAALPGSEGLRTKGDMRRLRIHRVASPGGTAFPLASGDTARSGDLLQVSVLAGPATFAAVLSLDGKGQVTRHIPETGDSAVPTREEREAPHSFLLDDTPGFERFVLIQSDHPFSLREAESILRRAGARASLSVPGGWTVQSILVAKSESRP